ncbi:MAG: hypothetical protein WAV20_06380 [Blastocatellia bacterium]
MTYSRLKKAIVSLALTGAFILSAGFANSSAASAQYRDRRGGWQHRNWDRDDFARIRRLDRNRQLRYRMSGTTRLVGYYDRFGRFHAYGFYDRFGRFHRY